jgi:hypothetical protein
LYINPLIIRGFSGNPTTDLIYGHTTAIVHSTSTVYTSTVYTASTIIHRALAAIVHNASTTTIIHRTTTTTLIHLTSTIVHHNSTSI